MRLLYLVPYVPTPIRTRPFHLLKQLSADGHTITLATLYGDSDEQATLGQWSALGIQVLAAPLTRRRSLWNVIRTLPRPMPLQAAYCWQPELQTQLECAMDATSFDVVHVEHLRGAPYGLAAQAHLKKHKRGTPVVWDSVDNITHLFSQASRDSTQRTRRYLTRFELERTRAYERFLARRFAKTFVVSESERCAFLDLGAQADVVPNGVDTEIFSPPSAPREPATILLSGKMSYHANVTAAFYLLDEIMPRVWAQAPNARVCIVGQNPPPALRKRATEKIEITGTVQNLSAYLQRATIACAPIRYGAGTQNKVLEAMASGTAVVATPQAVQALAVKPDRDLLLGIDAEAQSAQIVRVLQDAALRERLERNGRAYTLRHHQWSDSARVLTELYVQAVQELQPIRES